MRVEGIDEQKSTKVLEKIQKQLVDHIASIERQLAALERRSGDRDSRINAQRENLTLKVARLREKLQELQNETGAFPNVVDWTSWLSQLASIEFQDRAETDRALQNLRGAGDPFFASYVRQAVVFLNNQQLQVGDQVSLEQLIDLLRNITLVGNQRDEAVVERARELLAALETYQDSRVSAALNAAQRFLVGKGTFVQGPSLQDQLENDDSRKAQIILARINESLGTDLGQYGLVFASSVLQIIQNAQELRSAGLLTSDLEQRLINNEFSTADIENLRGTLLQTVGPFNEAKFLSLEALNLALESLARLETADPANLALPAVAGNAQLRNARQNITRALNQAKEIIAVWQAFLPVPQAPEPGDIIRWVDNGGVGVDLETLDKARKIEKEISETLTSIRILSNPQTVDTGDLVTELENLRNGFLRRYNLNQQTIEQIRENDRIVTIYELTEGDDIQLPFKIYDYTSPVRISLEVSSFDQKSKKVTEQLLFETEDYDLQNQNADIVREETSRLARENPDAYTALRHKDNSKEGIKIIDKGDVFEQSLTRPVNVRTPIISKHNLHVYARNVANYQTGSFTLTFRDNSIPVQKVVKQFKMVVYEKKPCARTGNRFVRLFNEFGSARWETAYTNYEKSLLFQRQLVGDIKPKESQNRHAGLKTKEIKELLIKRRNYVGELDQYHIQEALRNRNASDPNFILARGNQIAIQKIDEQLFAMGYRPEKTGKKTKQDAVEENWSNAGYKESFYDYTDRLKTRPRPVWVGRCSHNPLPTPARFTTPRSRPSEAFSTRFVYQAYAPRRDGEIYSNEKLWYMQAAQMVALGAERYNYNWAKRKPEPPAKPDQVISYNYEKLTIDCLNVDLNDPQYNAYFEESLVDYTPVRILEPLPRVLPIASRSVKGFVSDSESDDEEEPVKINLATFNSDTETETDSDEEDFNAKKGKEEVNEESDNESLDTVENEFFPSFGISEEDESLVDALNDQTPKVNSQTLIESPFADKFSVSDEDSDDELYQKVQEIEQSANQMQQKWKDVNDQPLPDLDIEQNDPKSIKEWVTSLSQHSKLVRRTSREILQESVATLSQIDSLSEAFKQ